jgi:hypothetical protein
MPAAFTALEELGITVRGGLLISANNTVRVEDIRRVEVEFKVPLLGWVISPTHLGIYMIRLIVHGSFGAAVVAESTRFGITWFQFKWIERTREVYDSAKEAIEIIMSSSA